MDPHVEGFHLQRKYITALDECDSCLPLESSIIRQSSPSPSSSIPGLSFLSSTSPRVTANSLFSPLHASTSLLPPPLPRLTHADAGVVSGL